jgi:hypothetical protein
MAAVLRGLGASVLGTPPPLPLRPFAAEVLRMLEANQAAEREAKRRQPARSRQLRAQATWTAPAYYWMTAWM